jgi:hypothetical protein
MPGRLPRVHEVASEMGVDSTVALRALKDMGEFVKGPSSSIQVPVARKLRAALHGASVTDPERIMFSRGKDEAARLALSLPRNLPEFVDRLTAVATGPAPSRVLLRAAAESGNFFYAPSGAREPIDAAAATAQSLNAEDILAPVGLAVICGTPDRVHAPEWLLWWRAGSDRLEVGAGRFDFYSPAQPRILIRFSPVWYRTRPAAGAVFLAGGDRAVQLLSGLSAVIPTAERNEASPAERRGAARRAGAAKTGTQLVYLRRQLTAGIRETAAEASLRLAQWSVRGHWRNQWYPSEKDHHRIWIDEHVAGNNDAETVNRRKVFMISPRPAG